MGRRGVKPMPSALRIARGTHLERLNQHEPQPPADNVVPPSWLEGDALAKWHELAPQLTALRVMTNLDVDALARYCITFAEWRKHLSFCQKGGDVLVLKDDTGRVKFASVSPSATLVNKYATQLLRIGQEFGMTPSSRSQIVAGAGQPAADDPMAKFLAKYAKIGV